MHQKPLVAIIAAVALFASSLLRADAPAPVAASDRLGVMISIDGLAGYYLDDDNAEMPTLRMLAAEGARAISMKASTPTVTWPNHATLMTGDEPAKHGVIGNVYLDRATGKHVVLIADPIFDKQEIVKVPTIYDVAKQAGLKTAAVRWPASRNANTIDWQTPDVSSWDLAQKYTTPGLLAEWDAKGIHLSTLFKQPATTTATSSPATMPSDAPPLPRDVVFTKAFNEILEQHHPNLGLLHLADVDHAEHLFGPQSKEAYAAIKTADECVKQVWTVMQKQSQHPTIFIVSDHGFSPVKHMLLPNVLMKKAGIIDVDGNQVVGDRVKVVSQGGCAFVYVTAKDEDDREYVMEKIVKCFDGVEGYSSVATPADYQSLGVADPKTDPRAPDLILFSKIDYIFGDTAAGDLPFVEKPERAGSHGHDANFPALHATFIASGDGIRPGAELGEISNTDVAPTIAALMGLTLPDTDGHALRAALVPPAPVATPPAPAAP